MKPFRNHHASAWTVLALLHAPVLVGDCSSDGNPQPNVYNLDATYKGDSARRTDSGPHPGSDAGTDARHDGTTSRDAIADGPTSTVDAPLPTDGALPADALVDVRILDGAFVDAGVCSSDGGCYRCTPTTNAEFLNQCTRSACTPFDNATRLPSYDGGLPPLGH